jgi:8-amino-7-oxononanoate synthase
MAAAREGIREASLSVSASRRTTGEHQTFLGLEAWVRRLFGAPGAVLLPCGYLGPLAVAQTLRGQWDAVILEQPAHPCLEDAAALCGVPGHRFTRGSAEALRGVVQRLGTGKRLALFVEGVGGLDGRVAPLIAYKQALQSDAWIIVDDCHGAGWYGPEGRGVRGDLGASWVRTVQCITFSKAFGTMGGAVFGEAAVIRAIREESGVFGGTTPMPPHLAAATIAALEVWRAEPERRKRLLEAVAAVKRPLVEGGVLREITTGPMFLVTATRAERTSLQRRLLRSGIHPSWINYPGAPAGGAYRFAVSSEHSPAALDALVGALAGPITSTTRRSSAQGTSRAPEPERSSSPPRAKGKRPVRRVGSR